MMRVVIIDDEASSRNVLRELLDLFVEDVKVLAEASSALEGLQIVREHEPDLVFLDVEMPQHTGFQFLEFFKEINFEVIFTTAHAHYALKAFEVSAIGYLLKPVQVPQLLKVLETVREKSEFKTTMEHVQALRENVNPDKKVKKIALPVARGLRFISVDEIVYLKADGSYTQFFMSNGEKILIAKKLKIFEGLLEGSGMYRTHRSYLINLDHVDEYVKQDGGYVLMSNGDAASLARDRKEDFLKLFE